MSALLFCPKCGTKNEPINGKSANFCGGCGYNLKSLAAFGGDQPAPARPAASRAPRASTVMDITVGEEEHEDIPEAAISANDVEIITPKANVPTVAQVLGTASAGYDNARQPLAARAKKRASGKTTFAKFQEEAGKGGTKGQEIG